MRIPVLSIQQPFAAAYLEGPKRFENRAWCMNHRGPLLIHVSRGLQYMGQLPEVEELWPEVHAHLLDSDYGHVIGVVEVIACHLSEHLEAHLDRDGAMAADLAWVSGPYCIERSDRRQRITPFPLRGQPGLFSISHQQIPEGPRAEVMAFVKGHVHA